MPAAYDKYDYESYWKGRDYEHKSEVVALKDLLLQIPKIKTILDIGAGFGRLTPYYSHRAQKILLSDPSLGILRKAKKRFKPKKYKFIHSKAENLKKKIRTGTVDLIIMIRVLHHIKDVDMVFNQMYKMLTPRGYLVLEFANKRHFKAIVSNIFKGNLTFGFDIFPKEVNKKRRKQIIPFFNYHPDIIAEKLEQHGFEVLQRRSVSNIRSSFIKRNIPIDILITAETHLQRFLSFFNFGPSIFILAKKRG